MNKRYETLIQRYKKYKTKYEAQLSTKKGEAYTMLILSFFTMAFFGFFALRPTLSIIARLGREINDSKAVDVALTKKIQSLAKASADFDLVKGAIPAIYQALPESANYPELLQQLENISRVSTASVSALGVDDVVVRVASREAQKNENVTNINVTLKVTGTYEQLLRYMKYIVSNPRIINFQSMSLSPSAGSGLYVMSIDAQLKSYYYAK